MLTDIKYLIKIIWISCFLTISVNANVILINNGFEEPVIPATSYRIVDASTVPGWETTASDNKIEIWSDGFHGVPAYEGNQFAEINANEAASLYQDLNTTPDTKISWSIAHRGRAGIDEAGVYIGAPGSTLVKIEEMITDNDAWVLYNGTYEIPEGQTETRIEFRAINTSGGSSVGNFIDDFIVEVGDIIAYPNHYSLNSALVSHVSGNVITDAPADYGQNLTIDSNTNPTHGTVTLDTDGSFVYTPDTGWTGTDSFDYSITDGYTVSTATVTIDVTNLLANDDYVSTLQDTDVSGNVLDNDSGTGIAVTSNTNPSNGSVTVNSDGTYTYTPTTGYVGDDSFSYTITDSNGVTSTAIVYIMVFDGSLIAEYRLDECGYDGTVGDVIDNSINRLHGTTSTTGTTKTIAPNKICTAASFDGSNGAITVPHNDKLNLAGSNGFTVSLWVYLTGDTGTLVSKMSGTGYNNDDGWDIEIWDDGNIYFDINGFAAYVGASQPTPSNSWHHIVGVYDPNASRQVILYIDGKRVDRARYNTAFRDASTDALTIASGGVNGYQNYYDGDIDEVKIFNRALESAEVEDIYDNESAGRNWNKDDTNPIRVCNTCQCSARSGSSMVSFQPDFRNMSSGKDIETMLSPDFGDNYGGNWLLARRDYQVGSAPDGNNDAVYHLMEYSNDDLEYGKGYWINNTEGSDVDYACNLKTMDFDATIVDYPGCQSANGKCVLVDLEEPNGTFNNGPYIYTLTSFPVSKPIQWDKVSLLIDGTVYPVNSAPARTLNPTIWRYDGENNNYTNITAGIPGIDGEIDPCSGYWIELDEETAGKDVKLLIPQE